MTTTNFSDNNYVGYEFTMPSASNLEMNHFVVVSQKGNVVQYVRVRGGKRGTVTFKKYVRDLPCSQP